MNRVQRGLSLLAVTLLATAATAAAPEGKPSASGLSFLEVDQDYIIRIPEAINPFKFSQGGITQASAAPAEDGKKSTVPVPWSMTISLQIFQVVRVGSGSWVLLRHPASPEDFSRWSGQRRALAILAGPHVEKIRSKRDGEERLKRLREAADAQIPTSETWVNLDHAIAIAPLPSVEDEPKLSVQSIQVKPNN